MPWPLPQSQSPIESASNRLNNARPLWELVNSKWKSYNYKPHSPLPPVVASANVVLVERIGTVVAAFVDDEGRSMFVWRLAVDDCIGCFAVDMLAVGIAIAENRRKTEMKSNRNNEFNQLNAC